MAAYSSHDWVSGSTITAARINNLETQYQCARDTFFEKFSTASTANNLFLYETTMTFAGPSMDNAMWINIPIGIQLSRFELAFTAQHLGGGAARGFLFHSVKPESTSYTEWQARTIGWTNTVASTAGAGTTITTVFSANGGDRLCLAFYNAGATDLKVWNVKISGTSTTIDTVPPQDWFRYATVVTAAPSTSA